MARQSHQAKSSRIEVLEPLVLMSASAAEVEFLPLEADGESGNFGLATGSGASTTDGIVGDGEVLMSIPVTPNGGIGDGAVLIPIGEGVVESDAQPVEDLQFLIDSEGSPVESGSSPASEPVEASERRPLEIEIVDVELADSLPFETVSFDGTVTSLGESSEGFVVASGSNDDDATLKDNPTLMLDYAMSVTAAPTGTGGFEAHSGFVPDTVVVSEDVGVYAGAPPMSGTPIGVSGGGEISQTPNNSFEDLPLSQAGSEAQSSPTQNSAAVSDALVVATDLAVGFPIEQPPTYTPTIEGTDAGEWISGTAGDDVIAAGGGDDEIYAPLGDNFIDGGEGIDTLVVYEGYSDEYTIALRSDGVSQLEGRGLNGETVQVDLYNVERIQFNDRTIDLSTITTVVANPPAGNPSITGTDASEWVGGTAADDTINAGGGDDEIYAVLGENTIDGGDGEDTLLVYQGNQADYFLSNIGDGTIYLEGLGLNGQTVRNYLTNVERILFNDGILLTADIADSSDSVTPANNAADTAVAGASNSAMPAASSFLADLQESSSSSGDEILMTASQAAVVVQESGFEDEALTDENVASLASTGLSALAEQGVEVPAVSEAELVLVADIALDAADNAGIDVDSLTTTNVVAAGVAGLESLQQSGLTDSEDVSDAAKAAVDSLAASGFDARNLSTAEILDLARSIVGSEEFEGLEMFLLEQGIDLGALL